MKAEQPIFNAGVEGLMFTDIPSVCKVVDKIGEDVEQIELLFPDGCWFGYRDPNTKITYIRTTYSNEMLKRDRPKFRDECSMTLEEARRIFKKD